MNKLWIFAFFNHQVNGFCTGKFDIGSCRIKMGVIGYLFTLPTNDGKQYFFCCPPLMGWDDMFKGHDFSHGLIKAEKTFAAGVTFISSLNRSPLV